MAVGATLSGRDEPTPEDRRAAPGAREAETILVRGRGEGLSEIVAPVGLSTEMSARADRPGGGAGSRPRRRRRLPISDPDELLAALERLDERDRTVLKMRYGVAGKRIHNLREIAKLLGISRERVRQLEARAFEQLTELAVAGARGEADAQLARSHATGMGSRRALIRRWTLLLLAAGPTHVYELKKRFNELGIPQVTYRNLYELEAEGLVSSDWAAARHRGPTRRIYTLTGDGAERLNTDRQLLEQTAHTLTEFLTRRDSASDEAQAPNAAQSTDAS